MTDVSQGDLAQWWIAQSIVFLNVKIPEFKQTSHHKSWQGKIQCLYCNAKGWPGAKADLNWWGNSHGDRCRKKK